MLYIIQFLNVVIQFGLLIYITKGSFNGVISYYSVAYISIIFGSALNYKFYQSEIIKNKIHIIVNRYDSILVLLTIFYVFYTDNILIASYYITLLILVYLQSASYYINIHTNNLTAITRNFYQNFIKASILVLIMLFTNDVIIGGIISNLIAIYIILIQKKYENYLIVIIWKKTNINSIVASYVIPIVGSLVLSIDKIIGGNYISKNSYFELLIYNKIAGAYQIIGDILLKNIKLNMLVVRDGRGIKVKIWIKKLLTQIGFLLISLPIIYSIGPLINEILGIQDFNYFLYIIISLIFITNSIYGLYFDYSVVKIKINNLYIISISQLILIIALIVITKDIRIWIIAMLICQILGIYIMRRINE